MGGGHGIRCWTERPHSHTWCHSLVTIVLLLVLISLLLHLIYNETTTATYYRRNTQGSVPRVVSGIPGGLGRVPRGWGAAVIYPQKVRDQAFPPLPGAWGGWARGAPKAVAALWPCRGRQEWALHSATHRTSAGERVGVDSAA